VEVIWRGGLDFHSTLPGTTSENRTRFGSSAQISNSLVQRMNILLEMHAKGEDIKKRIRGVKEILELKLKGLNIPHKQVFFPFQGSVSLVSMFILLGFCLIKNLTSPCLLTICVVSILFFSNIPVATVSIPTLRDLEITSKRPCCSYYDDIMVDRSP